MTKKDYELIAETLQSCQPYIELKTTTKKWTKHIAEQLAIELKKDNLRFDRTKFLKACGIQD